MDSIDEYTRDAAAWLLEFAGQSVTLTTQTVAGYDDYGDPEYETTSIETTAEIVIEGTPQFERRLDGIDSSVAAIMWITDDHDVYTGTESDTYGPTTVDTETDQFDVYEWFDEGNGKLRVHLE